MEEIAVSKFKATCLAVIERVRTTGQPILITRFGRPVGQLTPPPPPQRPQGWLGLYEGQGSTVGDIISPAVDPDDWEVLES